MSKTFRLKISLVLFLFPATLCSEGDRSPYYQNCVKECIKDTCDSNAVHKQVRKTNVPPIPLLWSCQDNCRYHCMFDTVQKFEERGFTIPKFHGKEPASVLGSILNLITHAYMYSEIRRNFPIRSMPVVLFWHVFVWICMNAWVWSTIFHTRDVFFTEFMDYACALSMVMSLFIAAIIRVFYKARKMAVAVILMTLVYYVEHVRYLSSGRIDYDYNMQVNLFFGVLGSLIWVLWAGSEYVAGRRHAWRLAAFTVLSGAALALELFDFPPAWRVWDAHALWHVTTAPLPLLFYRFVIDDLNHLRSSAAFDKSDVKFSKLSSSYSN